MPEERVNKTRVTVKTTRACLRFVLRHIGNHLSLLDTQLDETTHGIEHSRLTNARKHLREARTELVFYLRETEGQ